MGGYHDAELPLRPAFTKVSFNLTEKVSAPVLRSGIRPEAVDTKLRVCDSHGANTGSVPFLPSQKG